MTGRPEALFPLFAKLETLEGVGPKTAQNFAQLGVMAPRDLLFTLPYSGIDRRLQPSVKDAILPATVTVAVTVGAHRAPANKGGERKEVDGSVSCIVFMVPTMLFVSASASASAPLSFTSVVDMFPTATSTSTSFFQLIPTAKRVRVTEAIK